MTTVRDAGPAPGIGRARAFSWHRRPLSVAVIGLAAALSGCGCSVDTVRRSQPEPPHRIPQMPTGVTAR